MRAGRGLGGCRCSPPSDTSSALKLWRVHIFQSGPTAAKDAPPTHSHVRTALRGEGDYAGACCGVRAEVAKAGARWFSAAYAIHEVDAGMCYATGCNAKAINLPLAGEPE